MSRKLSARFAAAVVALLMGLGALAGFGSSDAESDHEAGATWSFRATPGDDHDDDDADDWRVITRGATWS